MRRFAKRALALLCLLAAQSAPAQEEPTPFWGAPPPVPVRQKKNTAPARTPSKKKSGPPAKKKKAQPPAKRKTPPVVKKSQPPAHRFVEPLPETAAPPLAPAPEPAQAARVRGPVTPSAPSTEPPGPAPLTDQTAPVLLPPPAPGPRERPSLTVEPIPIVEPERERGESGQRVPGPRISLDLVAGAWGKGTGDGGPRAYDLAYGLRAGWAISRDALELDLLIARAGGTQGNPFANATATHTLLGLRAFAVLGSPRIALLLGAGAGAALAQTRYSVTSSGSTQTLDATSAKLVGMGTAALRLRLKWFEARAELSPVLRDGRLELLPLFALGLGL